MTRPVQSMTATSQRTMAGRLFWVEGLMFSSDLNWMMHFILRIGCNSTGIARSSTSLM
jgi:hypothetical protein